MFRLLFDEFRHEQPKKPLKLFRSMTCMFSFLKILYISKMVYKLIDFSKRLYSESGTSPLKGFHELFFSKRKHLGCFNVHL